METSYHPVIESVFKNSKKVEISMRRPINALKMNILPKFLVLFHVVALAPPVFFLELKIMFCNYVEQQISHLSLFFFSLMIEEA